MEPFSVAWKLGQGLAQRDTVMMIVGDAASEVEGVGCWRVLLPLSGWLVALGRNTRPYRN